MERKNFSSGERFPTEKEVSEFLPKVPIKIKDSPYSVHASKKLKKQISEFSSKTQESDINLFSKFPKPDLFPCQKFLEDRQELRLPVLSKKEKQKPLISSSSNYRSPTISPRAARSELEISSKAEDVPDAEPVVQNEIFKSPKRGSSATRGFRSRKSKTRPKKYSSKQRDDNLDTLLMYRNASDLEFLMTEYIRRQGLNENSKIFILTGQHEFIRRALKKRAWVENKNCNSSAFHFKWAYSDTDNDYKNLKPGQLFNHFFNNRELTTKSGLLKNLRNVTDNKINVDTFFPRCYDLGDGFQVQELIKDFNKTAVLNLLKKFTLGAQVEADLLHSAYKFAKQLLKDLQSKGEKTKKPKFEIKLEDIRKCVMFVNKPKREESLKLPKIQSVLQRLKPFFPQFQMEGCENVWIIKPGQNARGSGVRCVKDLEEILDSGCKMQSRVVQKYTESPLLLPLPMGMCKFDLRIWVLVTSFDPLQVFMYNTCYCRLCQEPYTLTSLDAYKHLANYSIQKSVAKTQSATIWSLSQLVSYLSTLGVEWADILPKVHYVILQTLIAVSDLIEPKSGCFELYGFDILLDSEFTPWLLEVNLSPACAERTEWITQTLDFMAEGILKIVLDGEVQEPLYNSQFVPQKDIVGNTQEWVLLYKGENAYEEVSYTKVQLEIIGEKFNLKRERNWERRFNMNRAAIFLQYHIRKFLCKVRIEKEKIKNCVMSIQKVIRRKLAWAKVEFRVKVLKTVKIQSFWRMKLAQKVKAQKKFLRIINFVQSVLKSYKSQQIFNKLKQQRACIHLQCWIRRKIAVDRVLAEKHFLVSVRTIQKYVKLWYAHKVSTAAKLQCLLRGFIARKECRKRQNFKKSILNIQKALRKSFAVTKVQILRKAKAERIIARYEAFRISIKALSTFRYTRAAITIQKYWRRHSSKKIFHNKKLQKLNFLKQISHVQKILKGYKERVRFRRRVLTISVLLIQKHFRAYRSRKYYQILKTVYKAAVLIQSNFRRYRARKRYLLLRRISREEQMRRTNFISKKKELEKRAIKVTERLFKGKPLPELPSPSSGKADKLLLGRDEKIERIRSIYNQFDENILVGSKYERSSLIKSIIDDMKPQKRDKSKPKKRTKKSSISIAVYGKSK